MIKADLNSVVPPENWFAGCIASVDVALSRNGIAIASTADIDHRVVAPAHPLALALAEYRQAIQRATLRELEARRPKH